MRVHIPHDLRGVADHEALAEHVAEGDQAQAPATRPKAGRRNGWGPDTGTSASLAAQRGGLAPTTCTSGRWRGWTTRCGPGTPPSTSHPPLRCSLPEF